MINLTILVSNIFKVGGVQRVVTILSNKLNTLGKYKITVLSMFKTDEHPYFELDEGITVEYIYNEQFNLKKGFIKAVRGLTKYINENKVDIFIFAGMGYGSIVRVAIGKKQKIKVIGWEHQSFFFGKKFGLEWLGKRIASYYMDAIVVLTKTDYQHYNSNLKKITKIVQIYNPVEKDNNSEIYNFESKLIISCGSLVRQKGFDYAVDVARIVFKEHPDWQWHIYGDGNERDLIENKISEYNLNNNLIIKGYCENVNDRYKDYSLYVMTSRHEGFPMVLIEAKINRLPIVSFDCKNGPKELVKDEINGFLIPCYNVETMSLKILELIKNNEKLISFSNNSSIGLDELDGDLIIHQWENLFNDILKPCI